MGFLERLLAGIGIRSAETPRYGEKSHVDLRNLDRADGGMGVVELKRE